MYCLVERCLAEDEVAQSLWIFGSEKFHPVFGEFVVRDLDCTALYAQQIEHIVYYVMSYCARYYLKYECNFIRYEWYAVGWTIKKDIFVNNGYYKKLKTIKNEHALRHYHWFARGNTLINVTVPRILLEWFFEITRKIVIAI